MRINFNEYGQFSLSTESRNASKFAFLNTVLREGGAYDAQLKDNCLLATSDELEFIEKKAADNGFSIEYALKKKELSVFAKVTTCDGLSAVSQVSKVVNNGEKLRRVTQLCSANVNEICYDENLSERLSDGSIAVYLCQNKWQGEGQWVKKTPDELGVYACTAHPWEKTSFRFDSVSSWSTGEFYPVVIIEDKKLGECWFFEIEGGHSWFFEIYLCGGFTSKFLSVKTGSADERLGTVIPLEKGESYETCATVYGVVKGTFEDAVKELTKYKRRVSDYKVAPIVFNDYMNCNWANETDGRLIRLIDKAAEVGADAFCIDDGWQKAQGLWFPADEKFADGFKSIIDYILSKGMIAGVWFEFETIPHALIDMLGKDIAITRNGEVVAPNRPLANMRSSALLKYLNERVDFIYDLGVRYIKNDHNNTEFTGSDICGEPASVGLERNNEAFLEFIDGVKKRHPDLYIENCGSGAMRSDNGTLKHFDLQSTSDQEEYLLNPSIASGSLALMPPEKAGIWCYPYPLTFDYRNDDRPSDFVLKNAEDGEQTIFNFVTALIGKPYISGRIDCADENNLKLIKEGVKTAKKLAKFIENGYPVFPAGTLRMSEKRGFAAGVKDDADGEIILAVWNLSDEPLTVTVDLTRYNVNSAEIIYPEKGYEIPFGLKEKVLTCKFVKGRSARLFRVFSHG